MKKLERRVHSPLAKKARRGFRGHPVATVAFYGCDDQRASKVAVGIVPAEGAEADPLRRWFAAEGDARKDTTIGEEILAFIREHGARTVVATDRIIGCPHEPRDRTAGRIPCSASRSREELTRPDPLGIRAYQSERNR